MNSYEDDCNWILKEVEDVKVRLSVVRDRLQEQGLEAEDVIQAMDHLHTIECDLLVKRERS